jgi:hypothetical protein
MTATLPTPVTEPITLAPDETLLGYDQTGRPVVRTASGRAGLTYGVTYLLDAVPYDDREAFTPSVPASVSMP